MEESSNLKLIMEKGPQEGVTLEFRPRSLIGIGRVLRGNTLAVKDDGISSKHLLIEFKSGHWVLLDLDSSNGTFLNDIKLRPMTPYDLNDGDKFKIGEYTSIIVKIEIGGESLLQRNPRRRAATVGKDGETDAVGVVAENRSRRVGANMSLASVSENSELRLEMGGESGNAVEVAAENRNRPGRARRARVLKNEPLQKLCEVETAEEMDNAGPIELKQGRQVRSRRTRVSKKAENVNCDSKLQKPESSGLDANDCRKPESSAWPDVIIDKRTQGGTRRKINLQNEPSESVENEVLKGHEVVEGFNLGLKGSKEEESLSGGKQNIPNGPLEVVQVDVLGEEGVEEINLRQEGYEKLVSTSGVKDSGVEVGDELDLEKMMLGEWFDYLEVYLPKQIHGATEEMIAGMRHRAEKYYEFMLQLKNDKEKGQFPMG